MDLSKLTIIKNTPDPLAQSNGIDPKLSKIENGQPNKSIPLNPAELKNQKLSSSYDEVRSGKLDNSDFQRKLRNLDPTMNDILDQRVKEHVKSFLTQTLIWYFELKLLISTGEKLEETKNKEFNDLLSNFINLLKVNPKDCSYIIRDLLKVFINDDPIQPKYKIKIDMVQYLSNQRPTFLNEITVLFDLYSKVYDGLSKELVGIDIQKEDYYQKIDNFINKKVSDIQPRFEMINRHILSSNLTTRIDYDLDINKLGLNSQNIKASSLGLQKRLNYLNDWLLNGIIHTMTQLNRLNGLKPITKEDSNYSLGKENFSLANTKLELWQILQDTGKFLESLKGLTDGSAMITGIKSNDLLDILEVNY